MQSTKNLILERKAFVSGIMPYYVFLSQNAFSHWTHWTYIRVYSRDILVKSQGSGRKVSALAWRLEG